MRPRLQVGLCALAFAASTSTAQPLSIAHQPVACAVAETFPRLSARFTPSEMVATARIVFQGDNRLEWYSVAMKREDGAFTAVLPKPKKSLNAFTYYLELTGKDLTTSRTPDHAVEVVEGAGACRGRLVAATLSSASVVVQGPAGAAGLPAGFASSGVVGAGSAAGTAGGAAAGGGGLSTGAILGITAGVGGAAAVAAVAKGGGEGDSNPGANASGQWVGSWRDNDPTPSCGTLAFSTNLSLTQSGTSLSGAMSNLLTTVPPAGSTNCASPGTSFSGSVASGSASGTSVQFVANLTSVSPTRIFTFTGVLNGTSLTGTYVTTIAEFPQFASRGTLTATRQ